MCNESVWSAPECHWLFILKFVTRTHTHTNSMRLSLVQSNPIFSSSKNLNTLIVYDFMRFEILITRQKYAWFIHRTHWILNLVNSPHSMLGSIVLVKWIFHCLKKIIETNRCPSKCLKHHSLRHSISAWVILCIRWIWLWANNTSKDITITKFSRFNDFIRFFLFRKLIIVFFPFQISKQFACAPQIKNWSKCQPICIVDLEKLIKLRTWFRICRFSLLAVIPHRWIKSPNRNWKTSYRLWCSVRWAKFNHQF